MFVKVVRLVFGLSVILDNEEDKNMNVIVNEFVKIRKFLKMREKFLLDTFYVFRENFE